MNLKNKNGNDQSIGKRRNRRDHCHRSESKRIRGLYTSVSEDSKKVDACSSYIINESVKDWRNSMRGLEDTLIKVPDNCELLNVL